MKQRAPTFRTHVRAHEAVINNEAWYGDAPPSLGEAFTAAEAAKRHTLLIETLLRAAKRVAKAGETKLAEPYNLLADKLEACRAKARCGSLACAKCARAFQKAKVAAQQTVIADLQKDRSKKHLVFASVIPQGMAYNPGEFLRIDIVKANRWLKDALKPVGERVTLGSADLGWESRRGGNYLQLHWHLAMWTSNPGQLEQKLKLIFLQAKKYERPVDVTAAHDQGFLPYMNKAIKLPDLLRRNRTHLPELLLVLDQTQPLDLLVLSKLRLSAQNGSLALRRITTKKRKSKRKTGQKTS
jgi:hypothetical protein